MNTEAKQRWIMCKAPDDHVILPEDSIYESCLTHYGVVVMAGQLAVNVSNAVGRLAKDFNSIGRQVWTGKLLTVIGGKIVRDHLYVAAKGEGR